MADTTHTTVPTVDLRSAARAMATLVRGVRNEALDDPTPCEEYAVRHLLRHVGDLSVAFRDAARKDLGPTTDTDPGEGGIRPLEADWRDRLPRELDALAEAWRAPDAWTGMTRAGGVDLPGEVAGLIALDELVLHGWDLARATGQDFTSDEASLRAVQALLSQPADLTGDGDGDAEGREDGDGDGEGGGLFGTPVPVAADAPLLDQVVGLGGRDPDWQPPKVG
ncbi:TIGR03086 family metal-binding protein [Streptomyces sp. NPDC048172]|uniref:TIGR03086 family metal-binding protein n=1 Tax=Streptomyces sp. NPDC048172 TaxID=3365505 RepID=UPI003722F653